MLASNAGYTATLILCCRRCCVLQAKESGSQVNVVIDKEQVLEKIGDLLKKQDLSRYVL